MDRLLAIDPAEVPRLQQIVAKSLSIDERRAMVSERRELLAQHFHALTDKPLERYTVSQTYRRDNVGVIQVLGPIHRYASMFDDMSAVTSVQNANRALQAMIDDEGISDIVLLIDSPGGGVDGVHDFVQRLSDCPKPLTAYIDGSGCSAAYWIASACDQIYTSATSRIGSIGVVITLQSKAWIADEYGVHYITNTEATDKYPEVADEAGAEQIRADANAVYAIFRDDVITNRPALTTAMIDELAGGVRVGQAAVAAGLADAVDDFDAVLARLVVSDTDESMEDSFMSNVDTNALQAFLVASSQEAGDKVMQGLAESNAVATAQAERLTAIEATLTAMAERDTQIAALVASNEALTARIAALEGNAPNAGQWQAGYVASQHNDAPASEQYTQPQGGVDQSFMSWFTNPNAK